MNKYHLFSWILLFSSFGISDEWHANHEMRLRPGGSVPGQLRSYDSASNAGQPLKMRLKYDKTRRKVTAEIHLPSEAGPTPTAPVECTNSAVRQELEAEAEMFRLLIEAVNQWKQEVEQEQMECPETDPVPGCTDSSAMNYLPTATENDGSCQYQYAGCTNSSAVNYNSAANYDDGSCIYYGCTNPSASNYNSSANFEDGSCLYYGCTNPSASNYNSTANLDDGSCIYLYYGCTNSSAVNYNSAANTDDGSCIYYGCTNPSASNYNSAANYDDGSCTTGGSGNQGYCVCPSEIGFSNENDGCNQTQGGDECPMSQCTHAKRCSPAGEGPYCGCSVTSYGVTRFFKPNEITESGCGEGWPADVATVKLYQTSDLTANLIESKAVACQYRNSNDPIPPPAPLAGDYCPVEGYGSAYSSLLAEFTPPPPAPTCADGSEAPNGDTSQCL